MFTLASSFRAVARRQSSVLSAAGSTRTVSSRIARSIIPVSPETLTELSEKIMNADDEMRVAPENGIVESSQPAPAEPTRLKGFREHQFITPSRFKQDQPRHAYRKRPALGPDAKTSKELDHFHNIGLNPLEECMNTAILSHFVTSMGKIQPRSKTNLTWKNQRRIGKAIRRAKMMGLIPILSKRQLFRNDMDAV